MKKLVLTFVLVCTATALFAQGQMSWKEKMQSIKIAYLTEQVGITPAEAQVFWPVYNEAEKEMFAAQKNVYVALKNLRTAEKPSAELNDAYVKAVKERGEVEVKNLKAYGKVLSAEKLAKLYVAEEKFRRDQIMKLSSCKKKPADAHPQGRPAAPAR